MLLLIFLLLIAPRAESFLPRLERRPLPQPVLLQGTRRAATVSLGNERVSQASWRQIRDVEGTGWEGLLPVESRDSLDRRLRDELIKYGELAQVTYDIFDCKPNGARYGLARIQETEEVLKDILDERVRSYDSRKDDRDGYIFGDPNLYKSPFSNLQRIKELDGKVEDSDIEHLELMGNTGFTDHSNEVAFIGFIAPNGTNSSEPEEDGNQRNIDIAIVFRGTMLPAEWIVNINDKELFWPLKIQDKKVFDPQVESVEDRSKEGDKPQVHAGWNRLYTTKVKRPFTNDTDARSPQQVVKKHLKYLVEEELQDRVGSITFVGHSLGGALAMIAAQDIGQWARAQESPVWEGMSIVAYTYAAPKVGYPSFRNALEKSKVPVLNVINVWDIVPLVPGSQNSAWGLLWKVFDSKVSPNNVSLFFSKLISRDYVTSGSELRLNSDNNMLLRRDAKKGLQLRDFGARHNLEGTLYMLATQYLAPNEKPYKRDVAFMNKSDDLLRKEIARRLGIPACWWDPLAYSGLIVRIEGGHKRMRDNNENYYKTDIDSPEAIHSIQGSDNF